MKVSEIAQTIKNNWTNPYFGAVPYLDAMLSLDTIGGRLWSRQWEGDSDLFPGERTDVEGRDSQRDKEIVEQNVEIMKVYTVHCSSGSYDGYGEWVHKIFLKKEDADSCAQNLDNANKLLLSKPCPVDENNREDFTDEEENAWYDWKIEIREAQDFHTPRVKEWEVE